MAIRVILVDDHLMMLEAISLFLDKERDIEVVGVVNDGQAVQGLVASLRPDVVVMDVSMPGMNGIEATRRLVTEYPEVKVVALSGFAHKQYVLDMLEAGTSGYVMKEDAGIELVRALRAVMKGQKYLCPGVAATVVDNIGHYPVEGVPQLRRREREVLQLLTEGRTSPEIAERLFISTNTVDAHRRNIMKKLDLHSVAELTKYAVRNGLTCV